MQPTIPKYKLVRALAVWASLALAIAGSGAIHRLPSPPLIIGALVLAALSWLRFRCGWWRLAMSLSPRTYMSMHLTRFVGTYFLFLHAQGRAGREAQVLYRCFSRHSPIPGKVQ